jgi:hypothetical protein
MNKNNKKKSGLTSLVEISLGLAVLPFYLTGVAAKKTYELTKNANQKRQEKLAKNIRKSAEFKVMKNLDKYKSNITDPDEIEKEILQEEKRLHSLKDKKLLRGALTLTGLTVLTSPLRLYKALTGEDLDVEEDTDMEL